MRIALLGNPNSGKTSLFNQLTGLHQKIGNYPGVTVEKKIGFCKLPNQQTVEIIDLPGTYSLYPKSLDEKIVIEQLLETRAEARIDLVLVVLDTSNLKRNLLLFTQIYDLGLPCVMILNQVDLARTKGIRIDIEYLKKRIQIAGVVEINARTGKNIEALKNILLQFYSTPTNSHLNLSFPFINTYFYAPALIETIKKRFKLQNDYVALQYAQQAENLDFLGEQEQKEIKRLCDEYAFSFIALQARETLARYEIIEELLHNILQKDIQKNIQPSFSEKLDKILIHKVGGYVVFLMMLFFIFQMVFTWATYPMNFIDGVFGELQIFLKSSLPSSMLSDLITDGVIAGLGGIFVFIPQIAILFAFISILEESGYMARIMFLMDKLMRIFGLNGKSVVPLISGVACAVPAIMATRNIDNWKERLITILVTPLMSCSARLPVYAILIALVIPNTTYWGIFNLQGLVLMGLYLLGFLMALFSAFLMHRFIRTSEKSLLIMEFPTYKMPRWKNVLYVVWEKVSVFVMEAGKIILAISIVLWVLASYGPSDAMQKAEKSVRKEYANASPEVLANQIAAVRLENSYAGQFGKLIEPIIVPLGYDWKIGIALITSFAAREVFVGTISTIYSVGSENEDTNTVLKRMKAEINPQNGQPRYTFAVGISLMLFYAFAMQCMSTVAVVYRETKNWKYPLLQFIYFTSLAYCCSFLAFQLLS